MRNIRAIRPSSKITTLFLAVSAVLLTVCIVLFPKDAFEASMHGLRIWWEIVFPALLPFLILSELVIGFGLLHFVGVLLEPIMRFIFRLPGAGGPVISIGTAAGYAASIHATARLREQKWISRKEGEHLLALAYLCSPVFIVSVVAAGFFHNVKLGLPMVCIHFIAWLMAGIILRSNYKRSEPAGSLAMSKFAKPAKGHAGSLRYALRSMLEAHARDGRGLGQMLGEAVTKSIQTMMMIGGFMMLFAVFIEMLHLTKLIPWVKTLLSPILNLLNMPISAIDLITAGLFELHLGTNAVGASDLPTVWQAALVNAMLAWGGFSVHAQVKSLVSRTDLTLRPYFKARLLHSLFAFVITLVCWEPLLRMLRVASPSWMPHTATNTLLFPWMNVIAQWKTALIWSACVIGICWLGSLIIQFFRQDDSEAR